MMVLVFLSLCASFGLGALGVLSFFVERPANAGAGRFLEQVLHLGEGAEPGLSETDRMARRIASLAAWLRARTGLFQTDELRNRLAQAGYGDTRAYDAYAIVRVSGPLAALFAASLLPVGRTAGMMAAPALVWFLPDMLLSWLIRRRRARIRKSMPDTLDLLVICVDAGLGLDQALLRVADELHVSHPDMRDELVQVSQEQRAGKPRLQAWKDAVARLEIPEMEAFVGMIFQTERFGTPIARALSNFAANTRMQRTQLAEQKAAKTTIKIIFPLVLFIFPSIFIVLLGPAALTMLRTLSEGLK